MARQHIPTTVTVLLLLVCSATTRQATKVEADNCGCPSCPMNITSTDTQTEQIRKMFRGLFFDAGDIDTLPQKSYKSKKWNVIKELKQSCNGDECQMDSKSRSKRSAGCCDTTEYIIQPMTVESTDGTEYYVVHFPDKYQLISTSTCTPGCSCSSGQCTEITGLTWVLIYDVSVTWSPPIVFVPVTFPAGCKCML